MSFLSKLIIVAAALALAGCGLMQPTVVYRTTVLSPPDSLLQDCAVTTPPAKDAYAAAAQGVSMEEGLSKREELLTGFALAQTKNLAACNTDKQGLRDWKAQQVQMQKAADGKK